MSVPLQALCLAIWDAVMLHVVCTLSPGGEPNPNPNPNPNANPNQGVSNASLTALLEPLLGEEVRRLGLGGSW